MTALVVQDRVHAWISPSSFERVAACTMSVPLSAQTKPRESGPDALIGTAAHTLIEHCLTEGLDTIELGDIRSVTVEGQEIEVDADMLDSVQLYLDFVRTSDLLKGRRVVVEQKLTLPFAKEYLGKPMFGFADLLAPDLPVVVVDYKNGFNAVSAAAVQLGLYVLAAVLAVGEIDGEGLAGTAVIVQPNAEGEAVKTYEWTYAALRELRERVIHVLTRVAKQDWSYGFGDHCRWCPAAGVCPHLAALARDVALTKVAPTPELVANGTITAADLDEGLRLAPLIEDWLRALKSTAFEYLVHGGALEHGKIDRKRTVRRWINEKTAETKLAELKIDPFAPRKIVTPAEAERRLPKGKHEDIAGLIEKPVGDLALVLGEPSRNGVNVGATLKAALQASVAAGYLESANMRKESAK